MMLLAALAMILWLVSDAEKVVGSSSTFVPRAVAPGWDREDIQQLADGSPPDGYAPGSLISGLCAETQPPQMHAGSTALEIGFGPPPRRLTVTKSRGWPIAWMTTSRTRVYDNAFTGAGWLPARTDPSQRFRSPVEQPRNFPAVPERPRWSWAGSSIFHLPPPEAAQGAFVIRRINVSSLLLPIAFALLVLGIAMTAARLVSLAHRAPLSAKTRRRMYAAAASSPRRGSS